jgi:hypothetical protein
MLFAIRLLWVGLLGVGIGAATSAQAGTQLFEASWIVRAFGNACDKDDSPPGPHCTQTAHSFEFYSASGFPKGILCHPAQPRCPLPSTPLSKRKGKFSPLGGSYDQGFYCTPLSDYGSGTTTRPAKGATVKTPSGAPIPPLYRNPVFFTPGGQPDAYSCNARSTDGFGGLGPAQLGQPVTGVWSANTTGTQRGGFSFAAAPTAPPAGLLKGVRTTGVFGEVGVTYPYLYSYTYATLRNDAGVFGPGQGPGSFNVAFGPGGSGFASINVVQGKAKFGGTMKMLGAMTTKVCYWLAAGGGGCSLGVNNWRYEAIGAPTVTTEFGAPILPITMGRVYTHYERYFNTRQGSYSGVTASGSRFPWTTGSVTVTAVARGPHKTIHYARGYDNRNTTTPNGMGTIQLVSPVLTRWDGYTLYETGGIAVLRIKFLPEPRTWAMLIAGVSLLGVGTRMRGR